MCVCLEITARGHLELAREILLAVSSQVARRKTQKFLVVSLLEIYGDLLVVCG